MKKPVIVIEVQKRQTPKSNTLKALDNNLPYELLRGKLGRNYERPWLKLNNKEYE